MASKEGEEKERFQTRGERERERELSSLFRFPAPLVPLLAGKDDDEDTKEERKEEGGLEALTVMEIQTRTRRRVRARCGHSA